MFEYTLEVGGIGADLFQACSLAWRGWCRSADIGRIAETVSCWIKVKNRQHHAFDRVWESFTRAAEIARLQRANERLRMERDI